MPGNELRNPLDKNHHPITEYLHDSWEKVSCPSSSIVFGWVYKKTFSPNKWKFAEEWMNVIVFEKAASQRLQAKI